MSGDHSRFTFDPHKNYTGVLPQQGRVTIDADWVEHAELGDRRWRSETYDILSRCVVPMTTPDAFEITPTAPGDFTIGIGRMYVDGIQIENHGLDPLVLPLEYDAVLEEQRGKTPTPYAGQPGYPNAPTLAGAVGNTDLVYVEVWRREIAAVHDPEIRDVALGGVDTAVRTQTVWQVKVLENVGNVSCPDSIAAYSALTEAPTGRLTTSVVAAPASEDPCIIDPSGGYRGLHNRLYRLELHDGGEISGGVGVTGDTPRFKWSRHDASVMAEVEAISPSRDQLTLSTLGRDDLLSIAEGDWIEIRDEHTALAGGPGHMTQIKSIVSAADRIIEIDRKPASGQFDPTDLDRRTHIVRWDQSDGLDAEGLIDAAAGPITLEAGIQVKFGDGTYRAGDSWSFAARTADGSIEVLDAAPPRTTPRHFCKLALVTWTDSGGHAEDCREFWPPRSGCCVTVRAGEDVQSAIHTVVAAGGGCVQLCRGVHRLTKPLRLHGARNLHLHGVGPASILHLEADDGAGALQVLGARRVRISEMTILGDGVATVIGVAALGARHTTALTLDALTVAALPGLVTVAGTSAVAGAAIRLRDCADIHIEDCRSFGNDGLVATAAADALKPTTSLTGLEFGTNPVEDVKLVDVTVRFARRGVSAFMADRWTLERCDIRSVHSAIVEGGSLAPPGGTDPRKYESLFEALETLVFDAEGSTADGYCVRVGHWDRCRIRACTMVGQYGVSGFWLGRTRITASDVRVMRGVVYVPVLDRCAIDRCRLDAESGIGVGFASTYSSRIRHNTIRSRRGVFGFDKQAGSRFRMVELTRWADELGVGVLDVATVLVHRGLLATGFRPTGLASYGALVSLIAYQMLLRLDDDDRGLASLVVDLRVEGNDIECRGESASFPACIAIDGFVPLGGLRTDRNRLHAATGQAVRINADATFAHSAFTNALLQYVIDAIARSLTNATSLPNADPAFEAMLKELARWWNGNVAPFFAGHASADSRVQDNSVVSRLTGIESNLFELSVRGNHVTMRETGLSQDKLDKVVNELVAVPAVAGYGYALGKGHSAYARSGAVYAAVAYDDSAGAALRSAAGITGDAVLIAAAADADAAAVAGDSAVLKTKLLEFAAALAPYGNTCAIWMKGAGCRVTDNHAIVPTDLNPDTRGRGTIRVWADLEDDAFAMILAAMALGAAIDERLGLTETLIARNEVVGGIGHGIEVRETTAFFDVKVQNNQVRAVAGAGISVDDASAVVGVEITDNQVVGCGDGTTASGSENTSGGIVVRNAALCRVTGNQVTRSGSANADRTAAGIACESILHLTVDGNRVTDCGMTDADIDDGGIVLLEAYGDVSVSNNEVIDNRGSAVAWVNTATEPDTVVSDTLQQLLSAYRGGSAALLAGTTIGAEASSSETLIDFEDLAPGMALGDGRRFSSRGSEFLVSYTNPGATAQTDSRMRSRTCVHLKDAYLVAELPYPLATLSFEFRLEAQYEYIDLMLNGQMHHLKGFADSDGNTLSGLQVEVDTINQGYEGVVKLEGEITGFQLGGMDEGLSIDNIRFGQQGASAVSVTTTGLIGDNRLALPTSQGRKLVFIQNVRSINMTGNLFRHRSAGTSSDSQALICPVQNLVLSSNTFDSDEASADASAPLVAIGVTSGAIMANVSPGAIRVVAGSPLRSIVYKGMNVPEAQVS